MDLVLQSKEVSLNGNVYDFSVDYNFTDKSDILNIHKYLLNKFLLYFSVLVNLCQQNSSL